MSESVCSESGRERTRGASTAPALGRRYSDRSRYTPASEVTEVWLAGRNAIWVRRRVGEGMLYLVHSKAYGNTGNYCCVQPRAGA